MDPTYVTLYDVAVDPFYKVLLWVGGIGTFTGVASMIAESRLTKPLTPQRQAARNFGGIYTVLMFVVAMTGTCGGPTRHNEFVQEVRDHTCVVVEGPIEDFKPMPAGGHGSESFYVHARHFQYSDAVVTGGFNRTFARRGPLRDGVQVRICYDPQANTILRLEVDSTAVRTLD